MSKFLSTFTFCLLASLASPLGALAANGDETASTTSTGPLIHTQTMLKNVNAREISEDEIAFFERSWMQIFDIVYNDVNSHLQNHLGNEEDADLAPPHVSSDVESFTVETVESGEIAEETDRFLSLFSNWFQYFGLFDTGCRYCDDNDDYYPYRKNRQLEDINNKNNILVKNGGDSGRQLRGGDNRELYLFSNWFQFFALLDSSCRYCDETDDYYPYRNRGLLMGDTDSSGVFVMNDEDKGRLETFQEKLLKTLKAGPYTSFHHLEDINVVFSTIKEDFE